VEILSIHAAINPAAVSGAAKKLTDPDGVQVRALNQYLRHRSCADADSAEDRAPKAAEQKRGIGSSTAKHQHPV
jgi:hypothetical protein